jgi:hypothetical protein
VAWDLNSQALSWLAPAPEDIVLPKTLRHCVFKKGKSIGKELDKRPTMVDDRSSEVKTVPFIATNSYTE